MNTSSRLFIAAAMLSTPGCQVTRAPAAESEALRALERERLAALVAGDTVAAGPIHAADFQLINPLGESYSRAAYLGGIVSGALNYLLWTPDSINVRLANDAAILRYTARLSIVVDGDTVPPTRHWHTDFYEKRNNKWQVVWSQATAIQ